jgi:hypothetical protein
MGEYRKVRRRGSGSVAPRGNIIHKLDNITSIKAGHGERNLPVLEVGRPGPANRETQSGADGSVAVVAGASSIPLSFSSASACSSSSANLVHERCKCRKVARASALDALLASRAQFRACVRHSLGSPGIAPNSFFAFGCGWQLTRLGAEPAPRRSLARRDRMPGFFALLCDWGLRHLATRGCHHFQPLVESTCQAALEFPALGGSLRMIARRTRTRLAAAVSKFAWF